MKPMEKPKQLNDLTLLDRFLFASVMEDEETLELAPVSYTHLDVYKRQGQRIHPFIVVVDRHRDGLLRPLLADHILVQPGLDHMGRRDVL